jgi:hypothetical protein
MTTITIPVDPDVARIYENAAPGDIKKLQLLTTLWLRWLSSKPDLKKIMDDISDNATARGLTEDKLEDLLKSL